MCPLPRDARKLLGVPLLATQTIYQALNWGERQKNAAINGWGGGGGGVERNRTQGRRSRGGWGGNCPPKYGGGGAEPPLALYQIMNKFNLLHV